MIFRTFFDKQTKEELINQHINQTFTQRGILKIYWDNAIKHSKMLHLFFVPDKNSVLRLDENKKYVSSMLKNGYLYESEDNLSSSVKEELNQIDWLYLFGYEVMLQGDYDSQTKIPYDINYGIMYSLGGKYQSFFERHLGCVVVPVEVTFNYFQIAEFNLSGKDFPLDYDIPLYFPIARILNIEEIAKESIGTLSYDDALKDLICPAIDFLYSASSSSLDIQISSLYEQMEDEFSKLNDYHIKQVYDKMLETENKNIFVSLRSSPQMTDDNEIAKLAIQDYNIIGYSYDKESESSRVRAEEKHRLQRMFQENYYKKYKNKLGKVMFYNDSLFDYNVLVKDILNDEWCKVDILKINSCANKDEECHKFDKTYNQMYLQYPEKLRIAQGYMRCKDLNRGINFDIQ